MAFPKKTQVAVASHNRCELDLSSQHVTTSDFLQYQVSKCIEAVPGQSFNFEHLCFSRLSPLVAPTFGRAQIQHRVFFVPMRTIFPAWNNFITDTPRHTNEGSSQANGGMPKIVKTVHRITNLTMVSALFDEEQEFSKTVATVDEADFMYTKYTTNLTTVDAIEYRKFTRLGRFAYKLLRTLGYNPIFTNRNTDSYSALPLLAAVRIFLDYFYPAQYNGDENSAYLQAQCEMDSTYAFATGRLTKMFKILYNMPYASDYFTAAWDTPTAPSIGHYSDATISDPTIYNSVTTNSSTNQEYAGTPMIVDSGISQFAINALRALTDYMKRHQIVGSKALDRYLSRFGVKLPNEKLNRSVMIKEYNQDVEFADVTSTADTEGAGLGYYAGKGLSLGDNRFDFTTDEYGFLMVISTVTPTVQYYQGMDRKVSHITKFDFYTPELDNLGTQALGAKELYVPFVTNNYPQDYQEKVFGFVPRYSEYKIPYSQLTGDLSLNSFKTSSEPWTLYRDMSFIYENADSSNSIDGVHHDINFVLASDAQQYNRIFQVQGNEEGETAVPEIDHFNIIHNFKIKSSFPGKSLYNDYNFEDEEKSKKVTVDVGGSNAVN